MTSHPEYYDELREALALIRAARDDSQEDFVAILDGVEAEGRLRDLVKALLSILLEVGDTETFTDERISALVQVSLIFESLAEGEDGTDGESES